MIAHSPLPTPLTEKRAGVLGVHAVASAAEVASWGWRIILPAFVLKCPTPTNASEVGMPGLTYR